MSQGSKVKLNSRVKAYKPMENTIKGNQRKMARNMLVVRQQTREGGMELRIK